MDLHMVLYAAHHAQLMCSDHARQCALQCRTQEHIHCNSWPYCTSRKKHQVQTCDRPDVSLLHSIGLPVQDHEALLGEGLILEFLTVKLQTQLRDLVE